jgi:hypothetical protein
MEKRSRITPYFLVFLCTVLVTGFGCSETFFNETAGDRITPDQHYRSQIDAEVSLMGAIMPLQEAMPKLLILDGLRSDMMVVTDFTDASLMDISNQIYSLGNPYTNTSDLYKVIININEVLVHIDTVKHYDRNFDAFFVKYFKGALIGYRAWTYLALARMYDKVAYIDGNMASLPANLAQKVLTKDVLIDTLINQMIPYIHTDLQLAELRIGNYPSNKALLGELYLEKNDYANAAAYLKLACESAPANMRVADLTKYLKVADSYKDAGWKNIFFSAESQIFENLALIPFSSTEGQYNAFEKWVGHTNQYMAKPSQILVDSFMAQIPAAGAPGDLYRGLGVTFGADTTWLTDTTFVTETYITKYEIDKSEPFSSDIIISRAADIHLLLAEALNRMGDPVSQKYALMLLNQGVNKENPKPAAYTKWSNNLGIRGRVYLKSKVVPATMADPDSITNLIEDLIMAERALELAYEGKRWNDLVRVSLRRGTPEYLAAKVAAKFGAPGEAKYDDIYNKLLNTSNWYLPFNGIELPAE